MVLLLPPRHAAITALLVYACGSAGTSTEDAAAPEGLDTSADAAADGSSPDAGPDPDAWAEVDQIVQEAFEASGVDGLGVAIYDDEDRPVFERMYGDFDASRSLAVASASKLVAGLVLLELVDQEVLSLDSTTGDVLGWRGPKGQITLRHLMSFTSGLESSATCVAQAGLTLEECVAEIGATTLVAAPGNQFDYGPTHLQVAAGMAEVVTGQRWNALFRELLADPLGLPEEVRFYTLSKQGLGLTNPRVAGGLRGSMDDYAALLAVAFHQGVFQDLSIASEDLFEEQSREPFPSVRIESSPMTDLELPFRYGLASWLECDTPAEGCAVLSSPGAFGWTPWYDREAGYYAIIGAEVDADVEDGVVEFSVDLAQSLKPAIRAAL